MKINLSNAFFCSATTLSPSCCVSFGSKTKEDIPLNTLSSKPKSLPNAAPTASTVFKIIVKGKLKNFKTPANIS